MTLLRFKLLALVSGLILSSFIRAESPGTGLSDILAGEPFTHEAPKATALDLSLVMLAGVGWSENEVIELLSQASLIYERACEFSLQLEKLHVIEVSPELHDLDQDEQEQLLDRVAHLERPAVFFINRAADNELAFAYIENTVSPSQGTAWLTRDAPLSCRAVLLAHEIGHIALDAWQHSFLPENLMGESCRSSNISNQSTDTRLTLSQCQTLWKKYGQPEVELN